MSDERLIKLFALTPVKTSFTMRDLDNVKPVVPPPRAAPIDHPRLAPPGMSGVKSSQRLGLSPQPPKESPRLPGEKGYVTRTFKPLVKSLDKSRGPER